jgi:hypothetical protein
MTVALAPQPAMRTQAATDAPTRAPATSGATTRPRTASDAPTRAQGTAPDPSRLPFETSVIAQQLVLLLEQRRNLECAIAERKAELRRRLTHGTTHRLHDVEIRVGRSLPVPVIVNLDWIPAQFVVRRPDLKGIARYRRATGLAIAGVDFRLRCPSVAVRVLAAASGQESPV